MLRTYMKGPFELIRACKVCLFKLAIADLTYKIGFCLKRCMSLEPAVTDQTYKIDFSRTPPIMA